MAKKDHFSDSLIVASLVWLLAIYIIIDRAILAVEKTEASGRISLSFRNGIKTFEYSWFSMFHTPLCLGDAGIFLRFDFVVPRLLNGNLSRIDAPKHLCGTPVRYGENMTQ